MGSSLRKSLNLLIILSDYAKPEGLSIKELSNLSQMPPSTVHRFLQVFKEFDLVAQDLVSKNYMLGSKLLKLGMQVRGSVDLRKVAIPILEKLAKSTGEDSYLTILSGNNGVFIEKVEGSHSAKIIENFGTEVPLHCGANRLALLSFQDDKFIENFLSSELKSYTDQTITDPEKLKVEIRKIREQGYAISYGGYVKYGCGIAAPVRDAYGQVISSLGIIGFENRFSVGKIAKMTKEVKKAARKLSNKLGYFD